MIRSGPDRSDVELLREPSGDDLEYSIAVKRSPTPMICCAEQQNGTFPRFLLSSRQSTLGPLATGWRHLGRSTELVGPRDKERATKPHS